MLRLLADENFNGSIVRGLLRRQPDVDVVRVQDVMGLSGADDRTVLAWAATEGRVLLAHDQHTVPKYAYERISLGTFTLDEVHKRLDVYNFGNFDCMGKGAVRPRQSPGVRQGKPPRSFNSGSPSWRVYGSS